jgi:hypothetical protein
VPFQVGARLSEIRQHYDVLNESVRREKRVLALTGPATLIIDSPTVSLLPARPSGAIICQITVTLDTVTLKGGAA